LTLAKLNFGLSATGCFGVHSLKVHIFGILASTKIDFLFFLIPSNASFLCIFYFLLFIGRVSSRLQAKPQLQKNQKIGYKGNSFGSPSNTSPCQSIPILCSWLTEIIMLLQYFYFAFKFLYLFFIIISSQLLILLFYFGYFFTLNDFF
jgi:hypothetical protein